MDWISVKDRLPPFYDKSVILFDGEEIFASSLEEPDLEDWHITHWMPLPEPPKED